MTKLKLIKSLLAIFLLVFSCLGFAQDSKQDNYYSVSHSYLTGDTTYKIGGLVCYPNNCARTFFPISVLEFPIDLLMVNVAGVGRLFGRSTVRIGLSKSIAGRTGIFRDSDYVNEPGNTRDIYSESKSTAEATIFSLDVESLWANFSNSTHIFYGLDISARLFSFEVRDTNQISTVPGFCTCKTSGTTITYDVSYLIPSLYVRFNMRASNKVDFSVKSAFSPLTIVRDEDQHLLRNRTMVGILYGESYSLELLTTVHLSKTLDLVLSISSLLIDTEGTQTQTQPGQPKIEVDETVDSLQHSFGVALQFAL